MLQLWIQAEIVKIILLKVLKKLIPTAKKATDSFSASGFFPFKAYKSGGVRFGPLSKRGPNPLVPPVKMKTGERHVFTGQMG